MQVENTTMGKFLGPYSERAAELLGPDILERPVLVTKRDDMTQVVDLNSGFIMGFESVEEILPKLVETFSGEADSRPKVVSSAEDNRGLYREMIKKDLSDATLSKQLADFRELMYRSGSINDRIALVEKTVVLLQCHKAKCDNGEGERIMKAQEKLNKIITYLQIKKLAPGQVPSVYELAIWEWVN